MSHEENPLLAALPPQTDYISYLTIVEHYLTKEHLSLLHSILRDNPTLTINIGWDLVQILIPLLPESEECLQDVAELGNPREVILKVTELLDPQEKQISEEDGSQSSSSLASTEAREIIHPNGGEKAMNDAEPQNSSTAKDEKPTKELLMVKFSILVRMLCVLHQRIKTRRASRFLSTSLKAILPAYAQLAHLPLAMQALFAFIDGIPTSHEAASPSQNGQTRPSGVIDGSQMAPDPEDELEAISEEEVKLQVDLICSFVTHVLEKYVDSLTWIEDIPGLAWTIRFQEKRHPENIILYQKTVLEAFNEYAELQSRDATVEKLLTMVTRPLYAQKENILWLMTHPETDAKQSDDMNQLTLFAPDLAPSRIGLLYGFAHDLYRHGPLSEDAQGQRGLKDLKAHADMVKSYIDTVNMSSFGSERLAVVDALLLYGFTSLRDIHDDTFATDEEFFQYLRSLSVLSAYIPSAKLRYHVNVLISTILHMHPSEQTRYNFIKDTLEDCPWDKIKVSAVGWYKSELLAASANEEQSSATEGVGDEVASNETSQQQRHSLFLQPSTLISLCPLIFPAPPSTVEDSPTLTIQTWLPLSVTALNVYYLLCSSKSLSRALNISELAQHYDVDNLFVAPLADLATKYRPAGSRGDDRGDASWTVVPELQLIEATINRIREVRQIGTSSKQ